jgi:phosphohistidine phosphatase SixA
MTRFLPTILMLGLLCGQAAAQAPAHGELVPALQRGGHVILMRHTNSPRELPDAASANADNPSRERQLDAKGHADAEAFGAALRDRGITVATVLSSPAYRALQTARAAGYANAVIADELGNESMRDASVERAAWLRSKIEEAPADGNVLMITHGPNINGAFAEQASGMGEGDALVFRAGSAEPVARIAIDDWPALAAGR